MIRILICCGGGFSSSTMTEHLKNEIIEKGLSDSMSAQFQPFHTAFEKMNDVDIIMCCPHLKYTVPDFVKKYNPPCPIYILPPRIYGKMDAKELLIDAKDIIDGFNQDHRNPWNFPGEERIMSVKRDVSYRSWNEKQKK